MVEARIERRLAPILAADVAGYSRLMGADKLGTLEALKALRRDIVAPRHCQPEGPDREDDRRWYVGRVRERC
jgi:adenylate cyclase